MSEMQDSAAPFDGTRSWAARLNRWIVALAFFALLALPIVWFERPALVGEALQENRTLNPFPGFSVHTFQEFDRWFSDRFGMRDALVHYGSRLQMARTGAPTNHDVVVGPDKWLFYDQYYVPGQPHFADLLGKDPMSGAQLETIATHLSDIEHALSACGIPFYFVIAPDKQTVYPEKLGAHVAPGTQTEADQLTAYLHDNAPRLRVIDLRRPLIEAKASAPFEIYKRTDSHWNSLGGFYGYRAMAQRMVHDGVMPGTVWTDIHQWRITRHPFDNGDIAINLLSLPGYFEDYDTELERSAPKTARRASAPDGAQQVDGIFSDNPQGHGSLLLYRDSFAGELMPYLSEDFAHMWSYQGRDVDGSEIARRAPSVVVLEIVERNLRMLKKSPPKDLDRACHA